MFVHFGHWGVNLAHVVNYYAATKGGLVLMLSNGRTPRLPEHEAQQFLKEIGRVSPLNAPPAQPTQEEAN